MEYNFREIEKKWQQKWKEANVYKVENNSDKPKFYVLDMFPYPSGSGLHVGHPLGYIASDIYARFKRLKGYNVLHPMGFDSFGLPAEQYAIETGQHPAITTEKNIARYREQLDNIGFCYDWSREVRTSDPKYYKWTQYIFLQLFNSWYNRKAQKTESISKLVEIFEREGNRSEVRNPKAEVFSAGEWNLFDEPKKQEILMDYRIAYSAFGEVNWCEALGTVLANDEVVNGVSERGGHPVIKKKMRQWYLRITEYADRLLQGLEEVDFSDAMKEMQRNWIGKSIGAEIVFRLTPGPSPHGEELQDLTPNPSPKERGTGHDAKNELNEGAARYITNTPEQWKAVSDFAKQNRKKGTDAENILWEHLRNRNFKGYKIRRQHPVAGYIPDFVCIEKKLIVEVDGEYHDEDKQTNFDADRSKWLQEHNYSIIRFTNTEITKDIESILQKIEEALSNKGNPLGFSSPSPSERGSGGEVFKEKGLGDEAEDKVLSGKENPIGLSSPSLSERGPGGEVLEAGIKVFTTRPDTIFGVDFMVLAPEHELVQKITTPEQKEEIEKYLHYVQSRSERERLAEVKQITGCFTGAYALNPFDGRKIPVWISEYVLAGYGTGAIMAVPCGDQRDFNFAKHFNIPITNIIGDAFNGEEANPTKDAVLQNSGFLDGMVMKDAIDTVINELEVMGIGKRQVNYRMRDAGFSRQRYWGEPFPIIYKNGVPYPLDENELPIELPYVENYKPGPEGEGPLANIKEWVELPFPGGEGSGVRRETNTMPGYAGSSWYFLRYMDPHNEHELVNKKAAGYWGQVDLYIGGTEHAVGHLLYSRMWTKALCDLGYISFDEPYKKLVNQGMIQGVSQKIIKLFNSRDLGTTSSQSEFDSLELNIEGNRKPLNLAHKTRNVFVSNNAWDMFHGVDNGVEFTYLRSLINVDISLVENNELDIKKYADKIPANQNAAFIMKGGYYQKGEFYSFNSELDLKFLTFSEVEKMSKSKYNVVNPDDVIERFGADTFRMYEMFLGPVEQSKPWDTKGIEGVHRFLRKLWRLFYDEVKGKVWNEEKATPAELKVLHKTIKKIEDDTERFSFNTAVSTFMIAVNELTDLKCHKKEILEPLIILLTPYAPHICEELYQLLNNHPSLRGEGLGEVFKVSVLDAPYPKLEEKYLVESAKEYPISINGKVRSNINLSLEASQPEVEKLVLENEVVQKWLEGKSPKKVIYVKGKMINVVV